jgi:hypothetical protein
VANEIVLFPDTVAALCAWLRAELRSRGYAGIHVGTEVPAARPARFVRLMDTGGTRNIDPGIPLADKQVTVEAWADSQAAAHDLGELCRALIWAARGNETTVTIARVVEVAGPGHQPDPISGQHRFTGTYLVTSRGSAA